MPSAPSLFAGLLVFALIGVLGTVFFKTLRRRQDEAINGVKALSAMRWREFSRFILDAMRHRGYDVLTPDDEAERGQQTEFLLMRNGERALLGCKHGSAYKLSKQNVAEFVGAMKFQSARSGLLVTPGTVESDARKAAEEARVELIDGVALWPEVAPLLPQSLADDVRRDANKRAKVGATISWAIAAVMGLAVGALFGGTPDPQPVTPVVVTKPKVRVPKPIVAKQSTVATPAAPTTSLGAMPVTPEEEDLQRAEVVRRVASLPGVSRAVWSTKSTLQVQVDETSSERFDSVCTVLTRFANLRTSRVYLQPMENSEQQPRFKQCATY